MATIADKKDILQQFAKGKAVFIPAFGVSSGATTAADANSNYISYQMAPNQIGTTLPGTRQSFPKPATLGDILMTMVSSGGTVGRPAWYAKFYRIGSFSVSNVANTITFDSATMPYTRTIMGATADVKFLLFAQVTTLFSAASSNMRFNYDDEFGNTVAGTTNTGLPVSAAVSSWYQCRLEDGDTAITKLNSGTVFTSITQGIVDLWAVELIAPLSSIVAGWGGNVNRIYNGLALDKIEPATPTSGSATTFDAILNVSSAASTVPFMASFGVLNNV